jgi:MFS transporter, DHA1 family, multidrug resistance protein
VAVWIAQMVSGMAFSFILPFIPLYLETLGVQGIASVAQWAGLISASTAVSMTVVQPIWGNLADRYGRKPMVLRSMLGGWIVIGLMGFVTSPEQLLVLRFLQGSITGVVAASTALVATTTPKARLGFTLGMMQVALFVGNSAGPLIGGLISDTLGYRAAFFGASVLLFAAGVIVFIFVHEEFTPPAKGQPRPGIVAGSRALLASPAFAVVVGVVFLIQLAGVIVGPVLTLFVAELAGRENAATTAGVVLAGTGVVSALSAVAFGRLSDRIGHTPILLFCLLGAAVAYFPQSLVTATWQLLGLRMLLGVFIGGLMPSANALVAARVPLERRGSAFGLTAMAGSLANGVGPLSGAAIATQFGIRAVFVATSFLFVACWGWALAGLRGELTAGRPRSPRADSG